MKNIFKTIRRYANKQSLLILLVVSLLSSTNTFAEKTDISDIDVKPLLGKWERNYRDILSYKDILWIEEYDNQVSARLKVIGKDDDGEEYISYPKFVATSVVDNKICFCFERNRYYDTEGFQLRIGTYHMMITVDYWTVERQGGALKVDVVRKAFYYETKYTTWPGVEDTTLKKFGIMFYPEGDNW